MLALAGCASGVVSQVIPVAGGEKISVPITRQGPKPGETDGYRVTSTAFHPSKDTRAGAYRFSMLAKKTPALRSIRVDDISDEQAVVLYEDKNPKFENNVWTGESVQIAAESPNLRWVFQITLSIRIYRFTLVHADGREESFTHPTLYPPVLKAFMRSVWGEKY